MTNGKIHHTPKHAAKKKQLAEKAAARRKKLARKAAATRHAM